MPQYTQGQFYTENDAKKISDAVSIEFMTSVYTQSI